MLFCNKHLQRKNFNYKAFNNYFIAFVTLNIHKINASEKYFQQTNQFIKTEKIVANADIFFSTHH